ncbi:MAG: glycogen phosphorylase, partial [Treponemataceae bacterium]
MVFNAKDFKEHVTARLKRQYGKDITQATHHNLYDAVAASAMELIMENWMATRREYEKKQTRQMYYFSAEFLMGRALSNNLINTL